VTLDLRGLGRTFLRRWHRQLKRLPPGRLCGFDLAHDLRTVVAGDEPLCLDVGANTGQTIDFLRETFRAPRIHAFEPSSVTFRALQRRSLGSRVWLHQVGVGEAEGRRRFFDYKNGELSSFLPLVADERSPFRQDQLATTDTVDVTTVDAFARTNHLEGIDLLKVDVQGTDLDVLRGADRAFGAGTISSVLVELNFVPLYAGQSPPLDVMRFLLDRGLGLVGLYESLYRDHALAWCTALFHRQHADPVSSA
jgi:FkbM family methyltransferase